MCRTSRSPPIRFAFTATARMPPSSRAGCARRWRRPGSRSGRSVARLRARSHEAVAATDRRDLEMQRRVLRVSAIIEEHLGCFVTLPDLHQLRIGLVGLAEVRAEAALAVV